MCGSEIFICRDMSTFVLLNIIVIVVLTAQFESMLRHTAGLHTLKITL
jgi:hypothetical protein